MAIRASGFEIERISPEPHYEFLEALVQEGVVARF
jgi:hypothetical protein